MTATPHKPRARDLGIPFDGQPGALNAITDVPGVAVGHQTLIEGAHIRTGVTAILPAGQEMPFSKLPAGFFSLNGNGEMTGMHWVEESGMLEGPVMITNTHSVGVVRDAVISWLTRKTDRSSEDYSFYLPVVAETFDGCLNDINGQHVTTQDALAALNAARSGPVAEGCVGGGTGMITHQFKAGIGTASRQAIVNGNRYTVGALVQSNYGRREQLTIAGIPVGRELPDLMPDIRRFKDGSIIIVIATDAPLLPHQCKKLARRAGLGLARMGSVAQNSSGDIFLAFSTHGPVQHGALARWDAIPHDDSMNPLFQATVEAVEESIVNALIAADTMHGIHGSVVHALPHAPLQAILRRYGRLVE